MKKNYIIFSFLLLIALTACQGNRFNSAHKYYLNKSYPVAIEQFDSFIRTASNGALITKAQVERSDSYYQIGKRAWDRSNWDMAIELFLLANSDAADSMIINCIEKKVQIELEKNNKTEVLNLYSYVITHLYTSPQVPDYIYKKIETELSWYNRKDLALQDYFVLCDSFPGNPNIERATIQINTFMPEKIQEIISSLPQKGYDQIIEELNNLKRYPTAYQTKISEDIAQLFFKRAEESIVSKDYLEAEKYFRVAATYDKNQEGYIQKRLIEVCRLFLQRGSEYLSNRDIDNAILYYNKTFTIIPNYAEAKEAIRKAELKRINIVKARDLKDQGLVLERDKKYAEAYRIYMNAYELDDLEEYRNKAFVVKNLLEMEKDPKLFAMKIIREYRGGLIISKIASFSNELYKKYGKDLRDSGWKNGYMSSNYKMEIRYDLMTPYDSYLYVWQVSLKERTIVPLNKLSEKLMGEQK